MSQSPFREPIEAFPYRKPSPELIADYKFLFSDTLIVPKRKFKRLFDILISMLFILIMSLPFICLFIFSVIEGAVINKNRGPFLYFYWSVSKGRRIKKWKVRQFRWDKVDKKLAAVNDWRAFSIEWDPENRTIIGSLAKKIYIDELPQFIAILLGDMSLVGPRPLSEIHYKRDIAQGNITRKLIPGGLLGFGHVRKGTNQFGDPAFEFFYAKVFTKGSWWELFKLDLWVLKEGVLLVFKAGGH